MRFSAGGLANRRCIHQGGLRGLTHVPASAHVAHGAGSVGGTKTSIGYVAIAIRHHY